MHLICNQALGYKALILKMLEKLAKTIFSSH